jgi:hypothetical protein
VDFSPGELARLRRDGIRQSERAFVIEKGEAGDIRVVLSVPIIRALRIALDAYQGELVFPECAQRGRHDKLPARGVELRRTYRSIAADLGIDELLAHYLLSHSPPGISARCVQKMILASGPGLRRAQSAISREIMRRLGIVL